MSQATLQEFEEEPLTDAEAQVYRLVEDDGLARTEIAEQTGREPTTIRTLLYRARKKRGES